MLSVRHIVYCIFLGIIFNKAIEQLFQKIKNAWKTTTFNTRKSCRIV